MDFNLNNNFFSKAGVPIHRLSESTHVGALNKACKMMKFKKKLNSFSSNGRSLFRAGLVGYIKSTLVPFMKLRAGIYLLSFITPWEVRWRAEEDDTNIDTGSYYIYYDTKYYKH